MRSTRGLGHQWAASPHCGWIPLTPPPLLEAPSQEGEEGKAEEKAEAEGVARERAEEEKVKVKV